MASHLGRPANGAKYEVTNTSLAAQSRQQIMIKAISTARRCWSHIVPRNKAHNDPTGDLQNFSGENRLLKQPFRRWLRHQASLPLEIYAWREIPADPPGCMHTPCLDSSKGRVESLSSGSSRWYQCPGVSCPRSLFRMPR